MGKPNQTVEERIAFLGGSGAKETAYGHASLRAFAATQAAADFASDDQRVPTAFH